MGLPAGIVADRELRWRNKWAGRSRVKEEENLRHDFNLRTKAERFSEPVLYVEAEIRQSYARIPPLNCLDHNPLIRCSAQKLDVDLTFWRTLNSRIMKEFEASRPPWELEAI
jgi:hypothetical protein